jgi:hypothetical protein
MDGQKKLNEKALREILTARCKRGQPRKSKSTRNVTTRMAAETISHRNHQRESGHFDGLHTQHYCGSHPAVH